MDLDELIPTFLDITSTDDPVIARSFLEMSDGDLQTAVGLFFENPGAGAGVGGDTRPSSGEPEEDEEVARRMQEQMYGQDEVRQPMVPVHEQLVSDYNYGFNGTDGMYGSTQRGIFNQADDDEDVEYVGSGSSSSDDEDSGMTSTQKRLARIFRPPWDIIEKMDLDNAKRKARAEKKWVLVNIQDVTDFRCQCLNRDFWSSNQIKDLVRENFVFLQYQHDSPNGEMFANLYPFTDYPHISIIDPWTGERMKMWSTNPEVHKFIEQVVDFMARFSVDKDSQNPMVRHTQRLDINSVSEEKQVDMAMKQSLGEATTADDTDDVVIIDDDEPPAKQPATYAEMIDTLQAVENVQPDQGIRIQIRSGLDGRRIVRKFDPADTVRTVFQYTKFAFADSLAGRPFTLTMQRQNLWDSVDESIAQAGLKNASILLDILDE